MKYGTLIYLFAIQILFASISITSCSDDSNGNTPTTNTNSTISAIFNGATFSNTQVNMIDKSRGAFMNNNDSSILGILDAIATFSSSEMRRVIFTITNPEGKTGTFAWVDPKGAVLSSSGVFFDIYAADQTHQTYQPVQGSTIITKFGNVSEQIEGTFNGTMRNTTNGQIITLTNGTFSITRLKNQ